MDVYNIENTKYHYDRIYGLPRNQEWCYSARAFQKQLNQLTKGLVLEKLYVYLDDYLAGRGHNRKCLNLSFVGGYVLLIFNKLAIEFVLHVEGMVKYSVFSPSQIQIEAKYDHITDQYNPAYADLIELKEYFEEEYAGKRMLKAEVGHTDTWGFHLEGFDKERAGIAADANDLPERIVFHLVNDVQLKLVCDDLEYCYIFVEKCPQK